MGTLWLACCSSADAGAVRKEVAMRDGAARMVRVQDVESMRAIAEALAEAHPNIVLLPRTMSEELERAIKDLSCCEGVSVILVLLDDLDPAWVARLCFAGATEVVALDASGDVEAHMMACTEEVPCTEALDDGLTQRYDPDVPPWPMPEIQQVQEKPSEARKEQGCLHGRDENGGGQYGPEANATDFRGTTHQGGDPQMAKLNVEAAHGGQKALQDAVPQPQDAPMPPDKTGELCAKTSVPLGQGNASLYDTGCARARRAPLVAAISGRGGCGKSTVLASMAWCAAQMGLRAAVVDLDLMFGNQHDLLGVDTLCDIAGLLGPDGQGSCTTEAIEGTAMRIAPGLTLWGPCAVPEQAELLSRSTERLIETLRFEADAIFVDTPVSWGDAAASAVSCCDRCLVVGAAGVSAETSLVRAVELACRIGVPRTKMTCVYNRYASPERDEERAMRLEMAVALRSCVRIADGGAELAEMLAFGQIGDVMAQGSAYAKDIQQSTCNMLKELGCPIDAWEEERRRFREQQRERPRVRLPWKKREVTMR